MVQYKRKRIKTGPNSWINVTQRQDGTTHRSVSNRAGNTTTNISNRGVRKTQNNKGMVDRNFWSYKPKRQVKQKQPSFNWIWGIAKKKSTTYNADSFVAAADRFEKSKANAENWTKQEWWAFVIVVTIICIVIQLTMRAFA